MGGDCPSEQHDHFDATLHSCCERDRAQVAKVDGYKQALRLVDPTAVRRRIASESVGRNAPGEDESEDESESDLGSGDDEMLEMLRRRRIDELKDEAAGARARRTERAERAEGTDRTDDGVELVGEDDLLATLHAHAGDAVLCALIQPEFSRRDDLIECLYALAPSCAAVACRLAPHSALPAVLGWHDPATVVLLLRDDTVVASVTVLEDGWRDNDLIASLSEVLARAVTANDNDEREDSDGGDGETPCTICGRRYLHTHITT